MLPRRQCRAVSNRDGGYELIIDDKLNEGYIVGCECDAYFLVPRFCISVECPHCGQTELPEKMLTAWTLDASRKLFQDAAD
jgi:hypothetical protein